MEVRSQRKKTRRLPLLPVHSGLMKVRSGENPDNPLKCATWSGPWTINLLRNLRRRPQSAWRTRTSSSPTKSFTSKHNRNLSTIGRRSPFAHLHPLRRHRSRIMHRTHRWSCSRKTHGQRRKTRGQRRRQMSDANLWPISKRKMGLGVANVRSCRRRDGMTCISSNFSWLRRRCYVFVGPHSLASIRSHFQTPSLCPRPSCLYPWNCSLASYTAVCLLLNHPSPPTFLPHFVLFFTRILYFYTAVVFMVDSFNAFFIPFLLSRSLKGLLLRALFPISLSMMDGPLILRHRFWHLTFQISGVRIQHGGVIMRTIGHQNIQSNNCNLSLHVFSLSFFPSHPSCLWTPNSSIACPASLSFHSVVPQVSLSVGRRPILDSSPGLGSPTTRPYSVRTSLPIILQPNSPTIPPAYLGISHPPTYSMTHLFTAQISVLLRRRRRNPK